jgi:hypothetical protein
LLNILRQIYIIAYGRNYHKQQDTWLKPKYDPSSGSLLTREKRQERARYFIEAFTMALLMLGNV